MIYSLVDQNTSREYDVEAVDEMNDWVKTVHSELNSAGALKYPDTDVRPLDRDYRKQIGDYLSSEFQLDYTAVMFFLDGMESVYHAEDDVFLVAYDSIQELPGEFELGVLAHEGGHRMGNKIIDNRLEPLKQTRNISDEAFNMFRDYLLSENFAERTKVAVGNTLDRDFSYSEKLLEESPTIYRLKGRIGPEELVDPDRDEDINKLIDNIEGMLIDLSRGSSDWI